jgi:hypothetical protein
VQLTKNLQKNALDLTYESYPVFMRVFLHAYATINTAQAPRPKISEEYISAFAEEHSNISLSFEMSPAPAISSTLGDGYSASHKASSLVRQGGTFDPTLSTTPRSSQSSGFASMLSLQRRIAPKKAGGTIMDTSMADGQRLSSWSSGSFRRQIGLSMASYRTLSTDNSESLRNSEMEWEPSIGMIGESVAF